MTLVYLALGWAGGIILAAALPAIPIIAWLVLVFLAIQSIGILWNHRAARLGMMALLAFALGGWRFAIVPTTSGIAAYNNTGGLTVQGIVTDEPDVRDDRIGLRIAAETVTFASQTRQTSGLVLVQAARTADVHYGDRITATGLLVAPAEFDTFSYADYLARGGVFSVMSNAAVEVQESGLGSPILSALYDLKARAARIIAQNLPEPHAALLTGILLGTERGIAPEVDDAFRAVGASHVIAISGFNMVIISGVVIGLFERALRRKTLAALLGILVIGLYTILVGANAAVVRAAIMSSLLAVAPLLKRKTYVPPSLAFVALVMSAINPTIFWDLSFQLSFFATLGLALFVEPLSNAFEGFLQRVFPYRAARTVGDFLSEPLIVSLAAMITALPLTVLYFGRLSLLSLVVNLLIVPFQAPLLIVGALATLVAFAIPVIGQALFLVDLVLLAWTIGVVRAVAGLPFADVEFVVDSRLILLYFLVLLGGGLMHATQPDWWVKFTGWVRRRAVVVSAAISAFVILLLTGAVILSRPDGLLHVWMLDMGHSNAILVQTPGGAHILVDGGRFPSRLLTALGDRLPFYERDIEMLVITQPDEMDTGALTAVLARYDVGAALVNGQPNQSEAYQSLQQSLASHNVITVRAGYTAAFDDGVLLEVLHPQRQPDLGDSFDENTLTLRLTYGSRSFLLTSDLSAAGQTALLDAGIWPLADVMQLPQHGTVHALDETFLESVQPQLVVLESDPTNRRGDPDGDTLAMLGDTPLFRTDESGSLHLWTDGEELWVGQDHS